VELYFHSPYIRTECLSKHISTTFTAVLGNCAFLIREKYVHKHETPDNYWSLLLRVLNHTVFLLGGCGSVGIEIGYGLEGRGSIADCVFCLTSPTTTVGPT
jgi:hypothetical protein